MKITNKTFKYYNLFHDLHIPMTYHEYQKGETILSPLNKNPNIYFLLDGIIDLYSLDSSGAINQIKIDQPYTLFGDIEFVENQNPSFFIEAKETTHLVSINYEEHYDTLYHNVDFLHIILHSLHHKLQYSSYDAFTTSSLKEKVIYHIEHKCENQTLVGVEKTASYLHCSRRQLQRILKELQDEHMIIKVRKGMYKLKKPHDN